ncbi:MAG: hypothetical protein K2W99_00945 [Chthoniobacterales bacterium]|nr:hypothetical protein [Chthoniobacterales bacterium]
MTTKLLLSKFAPLLFLLTLLSLFLISPLRVNAMLEVENGEESLKTKPEEDPLAYSKKVEKEAIIKEAAFTYDPSSPQRVLLKSESSEKVEISGEKKEGVVSPDELQAKEEPLNLTPEFLDQEIQAAVEVRSALPAIDEEEELLAAHHYWNSKHTKYVEAISQIPEAGWYDETAQQEKLGVAIQESYETVVAIQKRLNSLGFDNATRLSLAQVLSTTENSSSLPPPMLLEDKLLRLTQEIEGIKGQVPNIRGHLSNAKDLLETAKMLLPANDYQDGKAGVRTAQKLIQHVTKQLVELLKERLSVLDAAFNVSINYKKKAIDLSKVGIEKPEEITSFGNCGVAPVLAPVSTSYTLPPEAPETSTKALLKKSLMPPQENNLATVKKNKKGALKQQKPSAVVHPISLSSLSIDERRNIEVKIVLAHKTQDLQENPQEYQERAVSIAKLIFDDSIYAEYVAMLPLQVRDAIRSKPEDFDYIQKDNDHPVVKKFKKAVQTMVNQLYNEELIREETKKAVLQKEEELEKESSAADASMMELIAAEEAAKKGSSTKKSNKAGKDKRSVQKEDLNTISEEKKRELEERVRKEYVPAGVVKMLEPNNQYQSEAAIIARELVKEERFSGLGATAIALINNREEKMDYIIGNGDKKCKLLLKKEIEKRMTDLYADQLNSYNESIIQRVIQETIGKEIAANKKERELLELLEREEKRKATNTNSSANPKKGKKQN